MKRVLFLFVAVALLLSMVPCSSGVAFGAEENRLSCEAAREDPEALDRKNGEGNPDESENIVSGTVEDIVWELDLATGVIVFSGEGPMHLSGLYNHVPWYDYMEYIRKVVIEEGITTVGAQAFAYCYNMKEVVLPDSLTQIDGAAFFNSGLTRVSLGSNVTKIGDEAFAHCGDLVSVRMDISKPGVDIPELDIPEDATGFTGDPYNYSIGPRAFSDCYSLVDVVLGYNFATVHREAFSNCTRLRGVLFPENITSINSYCFSRCKNLQVVAIMNEECELDYIINEIGDAPDTVIFGNVGSTAEQYAQDYGYEFAAFEEESCEKGKHCYINGSCVLCEKHEICEGICVGGLSWTIDLAIGRLELYGEGTIGDYEYNSIPWNPYGPFVRDFILPDTLTEIGRETFSVCNMLEDILIPASVTEIKKYAFLGAISLTHVHFLGDMPSIDDEPNVDDFVQPVFCYIEGTEGWDDCAYPTQVWDYTLTTEPGKWIYSCNSCDGVYAIQREALPDTFVIEDPALKIYHNLNLTSDISINLVVEKAVLEGYDMNSVYMESTIDIYEGNETVGIKVVHMEPEDRGNYYYFTYTGLAAVNMNDMVRSVIYGVKDEQAYCSPVDTYSVATYAYAQMSSAKNEKLKTLCAELLRYGAKAQSYKVYRMDALADSAMTEDQSVLLSDLDGVVFGNHNVVLEDMDNAPISWVGKSLSLDSKVMLRFIFDPGFYEGSVSDLTLRMSYEDVKGERRALTIEAPYLYNEAYNFYAFTVDAMSAAELRSVISARIYVGETPVSATLEYSADTYGNGKEGELLELCKALFAYSDSAKAFFG